MKLIEEILFVWILILGIIALMINEVFPNDYIVIVYAIFSGSLILTYIIMLLAKAITDIRNWFIKLMR